MTTANNFAFDGIKQAFAPVTDALKNLQNMEVPAAAREFVKKAADNAKDRATEFHTGSEKVTNAVESALTASVSEFANINRTIQQAAYDDAQAFLAGIDKLASASSISEAVQIQSDLLRARGELLMTRAKASAEYVGKLVTDGAKSAQDNFVKVYGKTA
jgi:phasin